MWVCVPYVICECVSPMWYVSVTYKVSVCFGDADVHFRRLGSDNVCTGWCFTQEHLAPVRLVNGDSWTFTHHLWVGKEGKWEGREGRWWGVCVENNVVCKMCSSVRKKVIRRGVTVMRGKLTNLCNRTPSTLNYNTLAMLAQQVTVYVTQLRP